MTEPIGWGWRTPGAQTLLWVTQLSNSGDDISGAHELLWVTEWKTWEQQSGGGNGVLAAGVRISTGDRMIVETVNLGAR